MKKLFLLLCFFMLSVTVFGQETSKNDNLTITEKLKKYEGTFQIQVKNPRLKPAIPYNIDQLIEANRTETQVTYVSLGSAVRLMVLPKSEIQKKRKLDIISTY